MTNHPWTTAELQYLKDHYELNTTRHLQEVLNRSRGAINLKAGQLGLRKHPSCCNRFPKGLIPHNKGKAMQASTKDKLRHTWFTQGHLPHNTRHDGYLRRQKDGYWYIRLQIKQWRPYHVYLYEQHHQIQVNNRTHIVRFIDGNKDNLAIQNLQLISRSDNMRLNTIHRYPTPIKEAIHAHAKLLRKIAEHEK